ncbi:amino acid-binding protein [Parafrankia colletiae]|uniref:Amino acid-binding protein n=1 Tax=Parafrankia colletiae TaxID=573497 RepID=A0A1S1Q6L8_9ACTN|nr:amino acid-binding protein [Parafrankia colletiae]
MAAGFFGAALVGCSTDNSTNVSVACTGPGVTPDAVKIGFVVSDSGVGAEAFAAARAGMDARIGAANTAGGVHGRRVEYAWRDDGGQPQQASQVTQELVQQESVFGLVAVTVALSEAMSRLAEEQVPVVGFAVEPGWAEHQNMISDTYSASPETVGRYIQATGGEKVALVTTGTAQTTVDSAAQYAGALQSIGLTVTATIPFSAAADSPAQVVARIKSSGADSLLALSGPGDIATIVSTARATGVNIGTVVGLSGYDQQLITAMGSQLSGVSFPVYFRPFEAGGPAIERYRESMAKFAPESGNSDQQFAMFAYIYADLFLRGLELAGPCPSREGFISALRGLSDFDAGGLVTPVDLGKNIGKPAACNAFVQINETGTAFTVVQERLCADGTNGSGGAAGIGGTGGTGVAGETGR